MTVQEFFNAVQNHPNTVLFYFGSLFILTIVAGLFSKNEGEQTPWKYVYSAIIYLVCIPGIFAISFSVYFFLFERRSIMQTNLLTQVLPIIAMVVTILIIKKNVNLDFIPGFEKISGLMVIIAVILIILWIIDRTHIYAISFMPFSYILFFIVVAIFVLRYSIQKISN